MNTRSTFIIAFALLFLAAPAALAHTAFLLLELEDSGGLRAEVGFSDGSTGAGLTLEVLSIETGQVLSEYTIPEDGIVTLDVPAEPYEVVLDAGEGHRLAKDGPLREAASSGITLIDVVGGDRGRWSMGQAAALGAADVVIAQEYLAKRVSSDWGATTLVLVESGLALASDSPAAREMRTQVRARIQAALDANQAVAVLTHSSPAACPDWSWLYESFDISATVDQE